MPTLQQLRAEINEDGFSLSSFKGLTAAYTYLGFGTPSINGYMALINAAESNNYGSSTPLNDESIFINTMNALYQGNPQARANFDAKVAAGSSVEAKLSLVYNSIVSPDQQTDAGRAYFVSQADFYIQKAADLGVQGPNGFAVVAAAALIKITVDSDSRGIGDGINDLIAAVNDGSAAIPENGTFTPLETADGANHDADDAAPGPTVVEVPGPTVYVPVPGPATDLPDPVFKTFDTVELGSSKFVNGTAGDDGSGGLHFGDGTTPATGMTVGLTDDVGVMASMRPRQANDTVYQPKDTVVDGNTITGNYIVAAGTQQIATGSFADAPTQGGQALAFQFGSETLTFTQLYAAGYRAHIDFDLDPTAGVSYAGGEYVGVVQMDGTLDFDNIAGGPDIVDSGGNEFVVGNSTQYRFRPGGLANTNDGNQFTDHFYWSKDGVEVVGVVTNVTLDTGNIGFLHQY